MLIDNTRKDFFSNQDNIVSVIDLFRKYAGTGKMDAVTGFFSIKALALMFDEINQPSSFRIVLNKIVDEGLKQNDSRDLLNENKGIRETLSQTADASKAIRFLQQQKVEVKTIDQKFCHAKTYIYSDTDSRNCFKVIGSSNLTLNGIGASANNSNIELNYAALSRNEDFKALVNWFEDLWNNIAKREIKTPTGITDVKEYYVNLISNLFQQYTPYQLYHKVLFEMFKTDLLALDEEMQQELRFLEQTAIYKALYEFQRKGALSLIKMLKAYNGAILADAVGLGKTWTALSVMWYFRNKGYKVLMLCPKKLQHNWQQYLVNRNSRFESDRFDYILRFHTDLQDERLSKLDGITLQSLQHNPKLLVVIDESHNLRNDKSGRYKFLVDEILKKNQDVKVLHLSATPINNRLLDLRNQFKLMVKGEDNGFEKSQLELKSLQSTFATAQKEFEKWTQQPVRTISGLVQSLEQTLFQLTDAMIVARTRKLIKDHADELQADGMHFPKKEKVDSQFISIENIGKLKSFDDILASVQVNMTAYRPHEYMDDKKADAAWDDQKFREQFLCKMMYILLMKRLESSWKAFDITVDRILAAHENAAEKLNAFLANQQSDHTLDATHDAEMDEEEKDTIEDIGNSVSAGKSETVRGEFTLGKKNPIHFADIKKIDKFQKHLQHDIRKLKSLKKNLELFETDIQEGKASDPKLDKLIFKINQKRAERPLNPKVIIFTTYTDTAFYLYDGLKQHFDNIAAVSGSGSKTWREGHEQAHADFEPILESFAPYTKLYLGKTWQHCYNQEGIFLDETKAPPDFDEWKKIVNKHDKTTAEKLDHPIDILICTDVLSEGQNLQDCDCVINYDIHWNPVRLIQRMGRIDRLGSPNASIMGINFWPAESFDDFLRLINRVEDRMALMTFAGAEIDEDITPDMRAKVEDNPLLTAQEQKMLRQLTETWDDEDIEKDTFGLEDLSLEDFRQELLDYFRKHQKELEEIPNGVFTGFKLNHMAPLPKGMDEGMVALLGYPAQKQQSLFHEGPPGYREFYLLYRGFLLPSPFKNNKEVLQLLRLHKNQPRFVKPAVENSDANSMDTYATLIQQWLEEKRKPVVENQLAGLFGGVLKPTEIVQEGITVEQKFVSENFDLICWFAVSNPTA